MKTRLRNNKGQFIKKTKTSEFGFVNLSTYTSPVIKEVSGKDYIEYGADNNYFQYLIDRYNGSPTNNAAINGISQAIYGKGLNATNSSAKPNEYAQMVSLFKKDVVRKLCYDLKLMGQCAVQIIYSKDRKTIAQLEHLPIETLRAEKCNDEGDVPAYYYFKDWANIKRNDVPLRIPAFGMSNESIEILYIKPYKSGFYYYSPVDYQGGLQYCELEEEISNYHLNNIMNGLAPSMLINFNNGTPNQEERKLIENKIAQKFSGTSNAGNMLYMDVADPSLKPDITPIPQNGADDYYTTLNDVVSQKILTSHRITSPMLLGIKSNTGLGNNAEEIETSYRLFLNTVVLPFQQSILGVFEGLLEFNHGELTLGVIQKNPLFEYEDADEAEVVVSQDADVDDEKELDDQINDEAPLTE